MTSTESIISHLLEEEPDFDWKEELQMQGMHEVDEWLASICPRYGFQYHEMGARGWEKEVRNRQVSLKASARPGEVLMVRYERTPANRWGHEEMISVPGGQLVLNKLREWGMIR